MTSKASSVPTEFFANLKFRKELLSKAAKSKAVQAALFKQCRSDIIFFLNAFCIAEGTGVLTNLGIIPIEEVTPKHKVWDGDNWISQGGAIYQGEKEVIDAYGIELTSDHKVWTNNGWQVAGSRHDRQEIRPPCGYKTRAKLCQRAGKVALRLRLRKRKTGQRECLATRGPNGLRVPDWRQGDARNVSNANIQCVVDDDREMHQSEKHGMEAVWRARNQRLPAMATVLRGFLSGHGRKAGRWNPGANQQQRQLRAGECSLGKPERASQQHAAESVHRNFQREYDRSTSSRAGEFDAWSNCLPNQDRSDRRRSVCIENARPKRVYDLINCGPKQAFTVVDRNGELLLVHNCWCFEPRKRKLNGTVLPNKVPFITWEHQVPVIQQLFDNLGERDITIEKSRGEGASWIGTLLAVHSFVFIEGSTVGLISKDEDSADDPDNPDSLGWKIDRQLEWLPNWMIGEKDKGYKRDRNHHAWKNLTHGATINAYAATANVATGGRKLWMLMDEFAKFPKPQDYAAMASTQPVTDCRIFISTPWGASGAFYDVVKGDHNALPLVLDWKTNPTRNRGLYRMVEGKPVAIDPVNNPLPADYSPPSDQVLALFSRLRTKGFILEDRDRSPWYDRECDRPGATPQLVAQEYDRDYGGSSFRCFDETFIKTVGETIVEPVMVGDLDFQIDDLDDVHFERRVGGPLSFWMPLDFAGNPPMGRYVLGCDVSNGLGGTFTSHSTIVGFDANTNEQVLEFASRTIEPQDFADYCIALAKWLGDAYLCWEANGPGLAFSARVKKRHYGNVMTRKIKSRSGTRDATDLGWWTNEDSKRIMFADIRQAGKNKSITVRSRELMKEFGNYVFKDGKIYHSLMADAQDDSKGVSHGDRVIGACIAYQGLQQQPGSETRDETSLEAAPPGTFAARHFEHLQALQSVDEQW